MAISAADRRDTTADSGTDPKLLALVPDAKEILEVKPLPGSRWARISRILRDRYRSVTTEGRRSKGEFEATSAIYAATPNICAKPIAWSSLKNKPGAYFFICKYYDFITEMAEPGPFCENLARLHSSHTSPDGRFGFHCTTYNGDMPQDNSWSDIWEAFFANVLRHVLRVREERAGPDEQLDSLLPALFDKVIPRLLRPLETNGRKVKPVLVHGDLWFGNCAVDQGTGEVFVFDPAAFYGHNEYELGNWRPEGNRLNDGGYFEAYHNHIPRSETVQDYDDRNALHALRFNLQAATLFPERDEYLEM
ncbi:hypothetical protein VTG60DRAFT_1606 [Thermothelomyces hinnuleus]